MVASSENFTLANGLVFRIRDRSRRYYEDYHLVRLEIACDVPILPSYVSGETAYKEITTLLGDTVRYCRTLEKMGVLFADLNHARTQLLGGFRACAEAYMADEAFPAKLIHAEYEKVQGTPVRCVVLQ